MFAGAEVFTLLCRGVEEKAESVMKLLTPHTIEMSDEAMEILMKINGWRYS